MTYNTKYGQLFVDKTKELMGSGLEHVAKTLAVYNGDFPELKEERALNIVMSALEQIENNDEFVMEITRHAKQYRLEFEQLMYFATVKQAFAILTASISNGLEHTH